ncbi:Glycosyltransferase family 1 protein [Vibrio jasicida]|uniref:glycosyltransferase family 4 protein n=1 Tax=Vibrio jasicida TaxID=766224 RepID=UPI0028939A9C|nr:Glycosyltransferase family 1 protein [Vibrio jasicida]CAH1606579.1 Glycosyltransferase family 1 protein [Vibrio jasicida]
MKDSNDLVFKPTVFCWALISPQKQGSFEDYLWLMGKEAQKRGWTYIVCVIEPISSTLKTWLLESGCELICLDYDKITNSGFIVRLLKEHKVDILHTHFIGPTDPSLLLCKLRWGGKIVFTDHSSNPLGMPSKDYLVLNQLRSMRQSILSLAIDAYLPVSDFVASRIARNLPNAHHKIHRLYNGIDLARFQSAIPKEKAMQIKSARLGVSDDIMIVAFIGQLTQEKGIDHFLNVAKRCVDGGIECQFLIIGDGAYRKEVETLCAHQDYQRDIQYLGLRSDVPDILSVTDVFVMPSLWGEAFGLTAIEASACGVPVVASNIGGLPEVILHHHSGILIEAGDETGLYDAIWRLIEDTDARVEFGQKGRRHAEQNFGLDNMVSKTFSHYQRLLNSNESLWESMKKMLELRG